jgi:hypothetical protein
MSALANFFHPFLTEQHLKLGAIVRVSKRQILQRVPRLDAVWIFKVFAHGLNIATTLDVDLANLFFGFLELALQVQKLLGQNLNVNILFIKLCWFFHILRSLFIAILLLDYHFG